MTTEYIDVSDKTLKEVLEETEKSIITNSLIRNGWNQAKTAADLDISRTTMNKKIKEYGIVRP